MGQIMKYTDDLIKARCDDLNYIFICTEMLFLNNKKRRVVRFICNKHYDKGEQVLPVEKFMNNKKPCSYCNHSKLKETFKEELQKINKDIIVLSDYKDWYTKVKCQCKIDGHIWNARPSVLLYGGGCPICGQKKAHIAEMIDFCEIKKRIFEVNPNVKVIGEYVGYNKKIKCKCLIDGHEWETYVSHLIDGTSGCPECNARNIRLRCGLTEEEVHHKIENLPIKMIGKYQNAHIPIKFECEKHHIEFYARPRNLFYKNSVGCPECMKEFASYGERELHKTLDNLNIEFVSQYVFDDCKNINHLRFDAYSDEIKTAFEFQGGQHYFPVDFAGKGRDWAEKQLSINQHRDEIKRNYCNDHDIKLIEIPYWELNNMQKYISERL